MRRLVLIALWLVPAIATSEPRPADPTPVLVAAKAKLAKYRSLHYTVHHHGILVEPAGLLESRLTSPVTVARIGGRVGLRFESTATSRYHCRRAGCSEASSSSESITHHVFDGRVYYSYVQADGGQRVTRQTLAAAPLFTLLELGDLFDTGDAIPVWVTRAPDVVLAGKTLHVIVRTLRSATVELYYLDRDTGLIHTEVVITGPHLSVRTYTEVRIDAPVPAPTFVFVPPAGVTVSDLDARR